jgi:CBS domain-containing protein
MRRMFDMVRNQNPLTLPPETTVQQACRSMRERRVGAVLVTGPGQRLLGIFTGRDAVGRVLAECIDPAKTTLAQVMTREPHCLPPAKIAIEALRMMEDCGCRHIPVVENQKVVGIVSRGDFRGAELERLDEETGIWERIR